MPAPTPLPYDIIYVHLHGGAFEAESLINCSYAIHFLSGALIGKRLIGKHSFSYRIHKI